MLVITYKQRYFQNAHQNFFSEFEISNYLGFVSQTEPILQEFSIAQFSILNFMQSTLHMQFSTAFCPLCLPPPPHAHTDMHAQLMCISAFIIAQI